MTDNAPIDPRGGAFVRGLAGLLGLQFSNVADYRLAQRWAEAAYDAGRRGGVARPELFPPRVDRP